MKFSTKIRYDSGNFVYSDGFSLKGQERYGNMTRVYYREAVGALVVFDMTRLSTFQAVLKWKGDLDSKVNMMEHGRRTRGKLNYYDNTGWIKQYICPQMLSFNISFLPSLIYFCFRSRYPERLLITSTEHELAALYVTE